MEVIAFLAVGLYCLSQRVDFLPSLGVAFVAAITVAVVTKVITDALSSTPTLLVLVFIVIVGYFLISALNYLRRH